MNNWNSLLHVYYSYTKHSRYQMSIFVAQRYVEYAIDIYVIMDNT